MKKGCVNYSFIYNGIDIMSINSDDVVYSEEGTTQGDTSAMAMYACGLMPLVWSLEESEVKDIETKIKQVYYADDAASAGKLNGIAEWWEQLKEQGPAYGYFPKPSKSWLIVKPKYYEKAKQLFPDVNITDKGHRYLGSYIGCESGLEEFVRGEMESWKEDIEGLCKIALSEPQLAYSAFLYGTSKRWNFLARTTPGVSELLLNYQY